MEYIITIDQGTTGSRVFLIDRKGETIASAYKEHTQHFPQAGWVEHDAAEIWKNVCDLMNEALQKAGADPKDAVGIGITNQRETTVIWEKSTGEPLYHAIVWQCRRTSGEIDRLKNAGHEPEFRAKTGLVLDAYFSGTKKQWLLDHVNGARDKATDGSLLAGTIDSYLLYRLTGGEVHATDYTNASRTLLFNIHEKKWDSNLCKILNVPEAILPEVKASAGLFGKTKGLEYLPDGIPIYSMVGDQQSALFGQLCVEPGSAKNTYGTGCFMLMNLGDKNLESKHGLLTTLACDAKGQPVYALEGAVFIAGAVMQYLRDSLRFFKDAKESEAMARSVTKEDTVVFVPAFAGLGAPYWDQDARGAIFGLTRDTSPEQITRAALKSIALQTLDVLEAMQKDSGLSLASLKVDGGATANNYLMEYQAAVLKTPVIRPRNTESTVLGAAYLAGIASGFWSSVDDLQELNPPEKTFSPDALTDKDREREIALWRNAIERVKTK